jgi:hypothetical protein
LGVPPDGGTPEIYFALLDDENSVLLIPERRPHELLLFKRFHFGEITLPLEFLQEITF